VLYIKDGVRCALPDSIKVVARFRSQCVVFDNVEKVAPGVTYECESILYCVIAVYCTEAVGLIS